MAHNRRALLFGLGIGIVLALGSEVMIMTIRSGDPTPFVPLYPHAIAPTRTIVEESDPRMVIRFGVLFHQTTTFTTQDSVEAIRSFYHQNAAKYRCRQESSVDYQDDLAFRCWKSRGNEAGVDYLTTITIVPIDGQLNQVTVQQVNTASAF